MRVMGLSIALLALLVVEVQARQDVAKDPEGKTVGIVLDCDSCKEAEEGKPCGSGVESGFHEGSPCGQCLVNANFDKPLITPYDLHMFGYLKDESGEPVVGKFVRLYLPKGWSVRTRSGKDGLFILRVGATLERKSEKLIVVELGERRVKKDGEDGQYSLFMVREGYQPCSEGK